jgi:hypothetical protein
MKTSCYQRDPSTASICTQFSSRQYFRDTSPRRLSGMRLLIGFSMQHIGAGTKDEATDVKAATDAAPSDEATVAKSPGAAAAAAAAASVVAVQCEVSMPRWRCSVVC